MALDTPTARLFVALWPTPAERSAMAAWAAACRWPAGAQPVPEERLHLTLQFLGAVPRERVAALLAALPRHPPRFTLACNRPTLWPGGIAVLTPDPVPAALLQLQAQVEARLRPLGFTPEARPFSPHVTLARKAQGLHWPGQPPAMRWRPSRVVLVESLRAQAGAAPRYRLVTRA